LDERLDLVGAGVALLVYVSSIMVFAARIIFDLPPGHLIGIPFLLAACPLGYLIYEAGRVGRPGLYYVQVGLMLASVIVVFLFDYVFAIGWRDNQQIVVPFVTLYFGGLGGMIGVASRAGQRWLVAAVVLFFTTAILAFVQRAVTGL
jgi:hypothetical protein